MRQNARGWQIGSVHMMLAGSYALHITHYDENYTYSEYVSVTCSKYYSDNGYNGCCTPNIIYRLNLMDGQLAWLMSFNQTLPLRASVDCSNEFSEGHGDWAQR